MKLKFYQVDAFTDQVFKGNYAGVVFLQEWLSDALMQSIAAENNLPETAFIHKNDQGHFEIRWFSPLTEIAFCGHATLAAAFIYFEEYSVLTEMTFFAKSVGELSVCRGEDKWIYMSFPNLKPVPMDTMPPALLNGLSIKPQYVLVSRQAYFAVYSTEQDVWDLIINTAALKKLAPHDVVATAASSSSTYDFVSRYFWPANGGDEDPVTGSIHAGLAPLWAESLQKNHLIAYQASKRGGLLKCEVTEARVIIAGQAIKYLEGHIFIPDSV